MNISACGLICNDCPFYKKECQGCFRMKGKPFWAAEATETGTCPLYDCSINQNKYADCGDCSDLPCQIFLDLKDPNISDSEHQKSLKQRVANLRSRR